MRKKTGNKLHTWEAALLLAVAAALLWGACTLQRQDALEQKVIRLHVIANSDSEADQALKLRVRDGVREDLGLRRVKRDGETVTEGAFSLDDTGGKDADDDMTREVRDPRAEEALEELFLDERAYECLSLMLDLPNKLQGKANNPEKINYYRMFFTDGVTDYVRSSGGQVFFAHEADLFQAAKLPFLDFFLDRVCRTVPRLASSETRPYGQLVEGRPDEPVEQPLPQDVYRSYLAREEGRRAGLSAISQQRTAYRAFLKRMLQC